MSGLDDVREGVNDVVSNQLNDTGLGYAATAAGPFTNFQDGLIVYDRPSPDFTDGFAERFQETATLHVAQSGTPIAEGLFIEDSFGMLWAVVSPGGPMNGKRTFQLRRTTLTKGTPDRGGTEE